MSTYLPLVARFDPASTEDLMEVFSDLETGAAAEDGIDIDLDLTTDPPEYLDDDEMIEDGEIDVNEDTPNSDIETGHDEQMIDEAVEDISPQNIVIEDVISEHEEDLDDPGSAEPINRVGNQGGLPGEFPQSGQSSSSANSKEVTQNSIRGYRSISSQISIGQSENFPASPDDIQDVNDCPELYGENRVEEPVRKIQPPLEGVSYPPRPNVTAAKLRLIQAQHQQHDNQPNGFTVGSSTSLSGSKGLSEDAGGKSAKNFSRTIKQELDSPKTDDAPQSNAAEWLLFHDEYSSEPVNHQNNATPQRTDIPGESQEHVDASGVPEMGYSQDPDASREDLYIHPILVLYEESEMFLFPPAAEEQDGDQTYFLSNEALAAAPIQTLLRECRNILEENISDQQELEINVNALGLRICESSVDAADTTLAHVLDIYLRLHYHDGNISPPPLVLSLTANVRFSHRLGYLSTLVAHGKGISQLEKEEDPDVGPDLPQGAEELQAVQSNGQAAMATENTINEPLLDEIHDQHHRFTQKSGALIFPESPHDGTIPTNSNIPSTSSDNVELTETKDMAKNATVTDGILAVSDNETSNPDVGSAHFLHAQNSSGSNKNLPEVAEDFLGKANDEEVQDGIDYYDDDDDDDAEEFNDLSQESSAGSSTVQGDDIRSAREDLGTLIEGKVNDDKVVAAPELVKPMPSEKSASEDVITYDSDDEGDSNGNSADRPSRNTSNVASESNDAVLSQPEASLDTEDTHTHDAVGNNMVDADGPPALTWDTGALDLKGSSSNYEHTDQDEGDKLKTEPASHEASYADECGESYRDSTLDPPTSQEIRQNIDYSNNTLQTRITYDLNEEPPRETARLSTQSAVDDDEITFDDELEDAAIKNPMVASTVYTSEQRVSAGPGSLKRAYDNCSDNNVTQDTKRVRSKS